MLPHSITTFIWCAPVHFPLRPQRSISFNFHAKQKRYAAGVTSCASVCQRQTTCTSKAFCGMSVCFLAAAPVFGCCLCSSKLRMRLCVLVCVDGAVISSVALHREFAIQNSIKWRTESLIWCRQYALTTRKVHRTSTQHTNIKRNENYMANGHAHFHLFYSVDATSDLVPSLRRIFSRTYVQNPSSGVWEW